MRQNLLSKILALGIIVLFIGVGIRPAFAVDTKISMVNKASVEDCGCNEVTDADLVEVERLLDRIEVCSKLLLVLSRHNPELREMSEELYNEITTLEEELTDDRFPIICGILGGILDIILEIAVVFYKFFYKWIASTEEGTLERQIALLCLEIFQKIISPIAFSIYVIGLVLDCWEIDPVP